MGRSKIDSKQIQDSGIEDLDNDTAVECELNSDEDKIRFKTDGTERMIIDDTGNVGIGHSAPPELLTLHSTRPTIQFMETNSDRAQIGINDSDNLLITNQSVNKYIVMKANDQGTVREGLRVGGPVPEVVVNEGSDSLVDFRVESDNQTHMLFVDGGTDKVGIRTSGPTSTFDVNGSVSFNTTDIDAVNDPGISYTCVDTDHIILVNTRPTAQNGIDSVLTITLPVSSTCRGRVITVKDAGGYSDINSITIQRQASDTIDGINTSVDIPNVAGWITLVADGGSNWYQIG